MVPHGGTKMQLTKEQQDAFKSISDWHKSLISSLIADQPREIPMMLRWLRESINWACDVCDVDADDNAFEVPL